MIGWVALALADEPVAAPPPAVVAPVPDLLFADTLYAEGDLEAARLEYRRAVYAGVPDAARAALRVGECWWGLGRDDEAEAWFATLRTPEGELGRAATLVRQHRYDEAATALERLDGPEPLRALAAWLAGWARLDARQEGYARADFAQVLTGPLAGPAHEVLVGLDRAPRARHRSPGGAAVLSALVPGAGQAWSGDWGDAAAAFLVNGLFVAGTVELARTEQVPGAVAVGLVGATFWGGNVLAAADSARQFDARSWADRLAPLAPFRCTLRLTPEPACRAT